MVLVQDPGDQSQWQEELTTDSGQREHESSCPRCSSSGSFVNFDDRFGAVWKCSSCDIKPPIC